MAKYKYKDLPYADQLEATWPEIGRARWKYRTHSVRQYARKVWKEHNNTQEVSDTFENRKAEVDKILEWWWDKKFYPTCTFWWSYSRESTWLADYILKAYEEDSVNTKDNSHPPPRSDY